MCHFGEHWRMQEWPTFTAMWIKALENWALEGLIWALSETYDVWKTRQSRIIRPTEYSHFNKEWMVPQNLLLSGLVLCMLIHNIYYARVVNVVHCIFTVFFFAVSPLFNKSFTMPSLWDSKLPPPPPFSLPGVSSMYFGLAWKGGIKKSLLIWALSVCSVRVQVHLENTLLFPRCWTQGMKNQVCSETAPILPRRNVRHTPIANQACEDA